MEIVIIRHGQAASPGLYGRDAERPLTELGHADTQRLGCRLKAAGLSPHKIFSSPYLRARQTAENLLEALGPQRIHETDKLVPHGDPREVAQWSVSQAAPDKRILLVSHLPLVADTISLMIGCAPHVPMMVPGTAVHLTLHSARGPAGLAGMLQPLHTR